MFNLKKITEIAHTFLKQVIEPGDVAVDATAGNGHDTMFLAGRVGQTGRVYAFDIQKAALERTAEKLVAAGLEDRVELIQDSHSNMAKYLHGEAKVICFNLGYLPGGDHRLVTRQETTLPAVQSALKIISVNGLLTITLYPGHAEGAREAILLTDYCRSLKAADYTVTALNLINNTNNPPRLLLVQKSSFNQTVSM